MDLNIHATIKKNYIEIMPTSIPHKKYLFIIYLLEDEQELSLGMLDTSPTYLQFLIASCYIIFCFGDYWALLYTFILFLGLTY